MTGKADLRGVIVLEDVDVEEELCCVPRTTCLDLSAVEGSGSPCEALVPSALWVELRWYERLACWLLAEERRGEASPISGYLGYMPRPESFADSPLAWSDEELAELSYPPVVVSIREQASELASLHAALVGGRGGPLASTVSLDELRWAMQLVLSRAFTSTIATPLELERRRPPPPPPPPSPTDILMRGLPLVGQMFQAPPPPPPPPALGDGLEMAMMPMLDAFNHASRASTQCAYDGERNAFVMTATSPLKSGEQAFISYGDKSNDELLQLFGFVEEVNPFDSFLAIGPPRPRPKAGPVAHHLSRRALRPERRPPCPNPQASPIALAPTPKRHPPRADARAQGSTTSWWRRASASSRPRRRSRAASGASRRRAWAAPSSASCARRAPTRR